MSRFRRLRRDSRPASKSESSFVKGQAPHRAQRGTTCAFMLSSAALPPVRRTGLQTQDASGSKGNTTHALLARCECNFAFLRKENHHVRIKQECRPSFVRRSLEQGQSASDRRAFCPLLR